MSTRALFGNYKLRPTFPQLQPSPNSVADLDPGNLDPRHWGATAVRSCSVCDRPIEQSGLHQVWISLRVATDVLPLLVSLLGGMCRRPARRCSRLHPHTSQGWSSRSMRHPTGTDQPNLPLTLRPPKKRPRWGDDGSNACAGKLRLAMGKYMTVDRPSPSGAAHSRIRGHGPRIHPGRQQGARALAGSRRSERVQDRGDLHEDGGPFVRRVAPWRLAHGSFDRIQAGRASGRAGQREGHPLGSCRARPAPGRSVVGQRHGQVGTVQVVEVISRGDQQGPHSASTNSRTYR